MSANLKRRIGTLLTIGIFGFIALQVLDRLRIVVLVNVPWWGLVLAAVLLFLVIDGLVSRLLR